MSAGITAGARGAAAGLGQASAGNACRVPGNVSQATWPEVEKPRPTNHGQSRGGAPRGERARSGRSSVARAAPEARAGGDICSCGAADFVCAFRRSASLYLFGGETFVAFVLAAKLGRARRRENVLALPSPGGGGSRPEGTRGGVRGGAGISSALRALSPQPATLRVATFPLQGKVKDKENSYAHTFRFRFAHA